MRRKTTSGRRPGTHYIASSSASRSKIFPLLSAWKTRIQDLAAFYRLQRENAYSGRCRSAFRGDGDRDSEVMPITDSDLMAITIPPGCRSLFGDLRNGDRHQ